MVGITYGVVGAGVAEKDGYIYYVLQVKRIATGLEGQPTPDFNSTADPNVVSPVITNTPQIDGSIFHEVLDGQSLWSIATTYNISIAEIIAWNNLLPTPIIFPGERLLVRVAPTSTVTPTVTLTPIPPTRTITPTVTPKTPTVTPTVTMTPTPTKKPFFSIQKIDPSHRKWIGIGLIGFCAIGFLAVVMAGFIKKEK
jgi:LysM repeat protein